MAGGSGATAGLPARHGSWNGRRSVLASRATPVAPLPVEGEAPGHAHQPRPKPIAVAQVAEAAVRLDERLLRHVLSVLPVPQHAVRDAEGQRGRFDEPGLELLLKC